MKNVENPWAHKELLDGYYWKFFGNLQDCITMLN